jgi:hypothetical protein
VTKQNLWQKYGGEKWQKAKQNGPPGLKTCPFLDRFERGLALEKQKVKWKQVEISENFSLSS